MGTISTRKDSGKRTARNISHPAKNTTAPATRKIRDTRERKSSAPNVPTNSIPSATMTTGSPQFEGRGLIARRRVRFCQITKAEKNGTKKPCEKFGSDHH